MSATDLREPATAGPTTTSLGIIDVRETRLASVSVKNLDATQTVTVSLRRRAHLGDDFADAQYYPELEAIAPGVQKQVDVDVGVNMELEALGVASGAGASVMLTMRSDTRGRR
jgi:hypothetical protein